MEQMSPHSPRKEPTSQHLVVGLSASRTADKECLLCKPPGLWYFVTALGC